MGDHLPALGVERAGYRESGLFRKDFGQLDSGMQMRNWSTPLLIIDGKDKPQNLGTIAMHELPAIIMHFLSLPARLIQHRHQTFGGKHLRYGKGHVLHYSDPAKASACRDTLATLSPQEGRPPDEECAFVMQVIANQRVVAHDLLYGHQYAMKDGTPAL